MVLVSLKNIEKSYGARLLYKRVCLDICNGDKIALVGANGSGKSTLLDIIAREQSQDGGEVKTFGKIAYMKQYSRTAVGIRNEVKDDNISGYYEKILGVPIEQYSGGEEVRAMLAKAFAKDCQLILLDEPTSNLDMQGIEILQGLLSSLDSFVMVSHDAELIRKVCNCIVSIDDGEVNFYRMNYDDYLKEVYLKRQRIIDDYNDYSKEKKRLENAILERNNAAARIKKAPSRMGNSEARLHKRKSDQKAGKITHSAQVLKNRIESMGNMQRPKSDDGIKLNFQDVDLPPSRYVITIENLTWGYDNLDKKIFDGVSLTVKNGDKIGLIGVNGAGKSTLLRLIEQGHELVYRAPRLKIGVMRQCFENLICDQTVLFNAMQGAVVKEHLVRQVLFNMGFESGKIHDKVRNLSGGEMVKLSLTQLLIGDYNALLLDEPTNYLDLDAINKVTQALIDYKGTIIFASHDRAFVAQVATVIYKLESARIIKVD